MSAVIRNWEVIGLTPDNFVIERIDGVEKNTFERPSDYTGIDCLTRKERGIIRRGLTASGRDRERPK